MARLGNRSLLVLTNVLTSLGLFLSVPDAAWAKAKGSNKKPKARSTASQDGTYTYGCVFGGIDAKGQQKALFEFPMRTPGERELDTKVAQSVRSTRLQVILKRDKNLFLRVFDISQKEAIASINEIVPGFDPVAGAFGPFTVQAKPSGKPSSGFVVYVLYCE